MNNIENTNIKFTIVTVIFNIISAGRRDTFIQCRRSVINLNYENVEHIIIDGASNDGTIEFIRQNDQLFGSATFFSEPDNGIYEAMNKGLQKATGDFIMFLNSDDYISESDGLSRLAVMAQKKTADFYFGPVTFDYGVEKSAKVNKPKLNQIFHKMPFSHPGFILKTSVMRDLGGFETKFAIAGDYDLILRVMMHGYIGQAFKQPFVTFRYGGISSDKERTKKERFEIWNKNFGHLRKITFEEYEQITDKKKIPYDIIQAILFDSTLAPSFRKMLLAKLLRLFS